MGRSQARYLWLFPFVFFTSGCKDTGGKVEGSVTSGVLEVVSPAPADDSKDWDFSNSSDYSYDTNFVQISGSKVSLRTVNKTFNSESLFSGGTYSGGYYNSVNNSIELVPTGTLSSSWTPEYSSIVNYWKMDGSWNDSGTDGRNMSLVSGSVASFRQDDFVQGGKSGSFTASGGTQTANHSRNFPNGFSAAIWVKRTLEDGLIKSIFKRGNQFQMFSSSDASSFSCLTRNAATYTAQQPTQATTHTNIWNHVVCVFDPAQALLSLYVNGALVDSVSTQDQLPPTSNTRTILSNDGLLDEAIIWTKPLSGTQVAEIYERQKLAYLTELSPSWTPHWSNLLGYWKMDGDWLDSSGHENHGTEVNTVHTNAPAKVGSYSGRFSAAGVTKVSNFGTSMGTTRKLTIAFWMQPSSPTQWSDSVSFGNGFLRFESTSTSFTDLVIYGSGLVGPSIYCNGCLTNAQWQHITLTVDGTTWKLYVNNVLKISGGVTGDATLGADLFIGGRDASNNGWTGSVDDLAIWNGVGLSVAEVSLIYNRQKQKYAGTYDSAIIDMGFSGAPWTSLVPVTPLPFYKEMTTAANSDTPSYYSSVIGNLATNLEGHWKLNGTDGAAISTAANGIIDSSGRGKHGTFTDEGGASKYKSSLLETGISFNGDGERIDIDSLDGASFPTNGTLSFWIKGYNDGSQNRVVFDRYDSRNHIFFRGKSTSNTYQAAFQKSTGEYIFETTFTLDPSVWNHIVMIWNTTTDVGAVYVNGKVQFKDALTDAAWVPDEQQMNFSELSANGEYGFNGQIDEISLWSRVLTDGTSSSPNEVLELYRRGANRVKYQVRSCVDSACACKSFSTSPIGSASDCDGDGIANSIDSSDSNTAKWIGPDGTDLTYFSELQNNDSVNSSGHPTGAVHATGLTLDWLGSFFTSAARPTANRYFQYRVYMESDDEQNLCSSLPCMPSVKSITVGPTGRYYGGSPTVVNNSALTYSTLKTMTRSDSGSCTTYQISSDDGSTWNWWNGSAWTATSGGVSTSNYLSDFTTERLKILSGGTFRFKAFLNTNTSGDFSQNCDLNNVGVTYNP
jgi:hypothetical protein